MPSWTAPVLRGERRHATVLLADVVNSTQLLEALGSEAWVEMMNRVFQIAGSEIYRYGGEIDQFRGDGLVAFFGTRTAHEDDPERAILAGLRMQAAVQAYATELTTSHGTTLELRVGINTGEVIVTQVGDRARHAEQTAMGEAVALAARMETAAEPGTVLVSEHTYGLVADVFNWRALGEISVKGVRRPVGVYRPLGYRERRPPRGERRGRQGLGGLDSPLVGRQTEYRDLQRAVQAVREGRGGAVAVVGEAGIGKSRLVAEVRLREERAAGRPLLWIEGRCLSMGSGTAYLPWTTILQRLLGLPAATDGGRSGGEPVQATQALLRERVSSLSIGGADEGPTGASGIAEDVVRALSRVLGLVEGPGVTSTDPSGADAGQELVALGVTTVLSAIARRHPVVLSFEDLHWADEASLLLLERVLPTARRVPLLVVCVTRPVADSLPAISGVLERLLSAIAGQGKAVAILNLESLAADQVTTLVSNLLASRSAAAGAADGQPAVASRSEAGDLTGAAPRHAATPQAPPALSTPIAARLHAASGGNPYFVEELVRSLIDQGDLACDVKSCTWQMADRAKTAVPDSLRGVLTARMDRLPDAARRCLQVAAAIGRIVSRDLLRAVLAKGGPAEDAIAKALDDHLGVLLDAQMLRPTGDGDGAQVIFKHQLMQEAAYNSLLQRERRALHRRIADQLSSGDPAQAVPASLIAYHWDAAGEPLRAIPYHLQAGLQAQQAYAHETARYAYKRALVAMDAVEHVDAPRTAAVDEDRLAGWRVEALRGLGQVAFNVGNVEEAEASLREAIARGREIGVPLAELIRLYHWLGEVYFWQERFTERIELGKEGLALLDAKAETVEVALMNQMVAIGCLTQGDSEGFRAYTSRTAAFIERLPYTPELLPAYEHVMMVHLMDGRPSRAMAVIEALRARGDSHRDPLVAAAIERQEGEVRLVLGDLAGARSAYRRALEIQERLGDTKHRVWSLGDVGWVSVRMGDLESAASYLAEMKRTAPELTHYKGTEYLLQGDIILGLAGGDLNQALGSAQALLEQMVRSTEGLWGAGLIDRRLLRPGWASFLIAAVYQAAGESAQATQHLTAALGYFARAGGTAAMMGTVAALNALVEAAGSEWLASMPADALPPVLVPAATSGPTAAKVKEEGQAIASTVSWGFVRAEPINPLDGADVSLTQPSPAAGAGGHADWVWQDPLGGCSYELSDGLTIVAAHGRNLWEANRSAPRFVTRVDGDVVLQARVAPVAEGMPLIGGLLLYWDDDNHLRAGAGDLGPRSVGLGGALDGRSWLFGTAVLAQPLSAAGLWLRLERLGATGRALISHTGAHWLSVGTAHVDRPGPLWVGFCAIGDIDRTIYHGAFPDGAGVRFRDVKVLAGPRRDG